MAAQAPVKDRSEFERGMPELLSLEFEDKAGRVDHPPSGSKDLADALAGVVYGLTMSRDVWSQYGVDPHELAPRLVSDVRQGAAQSV